MKIQHNMNALFTQNRLSSSENKIGKSLKKLSSGFKINSAADNAAGLAISEKLRALITGTGQAQRNIQNGISLVQTADGAMAEIHQMLNRGKELCVQASNGIYSDAERDQIQKEINSIYDEIGRISESTNFNGVEILKGNGMMQNGVVINGTLPAWVQTDVSFENGYMSSVFTTQETYQIVAPPSTATYPIDHVSASFDFGNFSGSADDKADLMKGGFHFTCCTCSNHYSVNFTAGTSNTTTQSGNHFIYSVGLDNINTPEDLVNAIVSATAGGNPQNHYSRLTADPTNPKNLIIYDDRAKNSAPASATGGDWVGWSNPNFSITASPNSGLVGAGIATSIELFDGPNVILQIGPEASDTLKIHLANAKPNDMGLNNLSVNNIENSRMSTKIIEKAINHISGERGRMGAYQNRLSYTNTNMQVYEENLTRSESMLRDTDMAKEMATLTKEQIISQSATAMLAQANQSPQGILALLK